MKRPSRRGLVTLALAGSLGATIGLLPACSTLSPVTTQTSYAPSDGVNAKLGDIAAENLLIVGEKGSNGVLSGALINRASTAVEVTIAVKGQPQPVKVTLPADDLVKVGGASRQSQVVVGDLAQRAGTLLTVTLSTPSGGSVEVQVPVLTATGAYSTVTATATPTPTVSPTAE